MRIVHWFDLYHRVSLSLQHDWTRAWRKHRGASVKCRRIVASTSTRRHLPPLSRAGSSQRAKLVCDDVDMVAEGNGSLAGPVA
jgi:hypothetical protein